MFSVIMAVGQHSVEYWPVQLDELVHHGGQSSENGYDESGVAQAAVDRYEVAFDSLEDALVAKVT